MVKVLIADAQRIARNGLQAVVEQLGEHLGEECLCAQADDALKVFRKAKRLQPDLVLMSAALLGADAQALLALREHAPGARLVVLCDGAEPAALRAYAEAGACALLHAGASAEALRDGLCEALRAEKSEGRAGSGGSSGADGRERSP